MRRTKEDAEITKQKLLTSALKIFSEQGYASTKLADIASDAEVTRGAIYHHFGNKAELYKALLNEYATRGSNIINEAISEGGSLGDILTRTLIYQMQALEDNPPLRAMIELSLFKTAHEPELVDVMETQREQGDAMVNMLSGIMAQAIQDGVLRQDIEPTQAARTFVAFQQGIIYLWLFNPKSFSIKEQAEDLAQLFMKGLLP